MHQPLPRRSLYAVAATVVLSAGAWAWQGRASTAAQGTPAPALDVEKIGPRAGMKVPSFAALDQAGTRRTLESLMGPKGAMIVFFRSAEW
jgi:hypothetical protein